MYNKKPEFKIDSFGANLKIFSKWAPSAFDKHEETLKIEKVQTEHNGGL